MEGGAGVTTVYDYDDDDLECILESGDEDFVHDLGLSKFTGSLGDDYPTAVQEQVMELLGNGSLQGKSELDTGKLFDNVPACIGTNDEALSAGSWVLQAYNSGRKGTLLSQPIGFGEVFKTCIISTANQLTFRSCISSKSFWHWCGFLGRGKSK